jgi:hypothetical protein
MCDCIIINKDIKIIGKCIFIGDIEICGIPKELEKLLISGKLKITVDSTKLLINEWEYKNGSFKKTVRGYIHKWL